LPVQFETN